MYKLPRSSVFPARPAKLGRVASQTNNPTRQQLSTRAREIHRHHLSSFSTIARRSGTKTARQSALEPGGDPSRLTKCVNSSRVAEGVDERGGVVALRFVLLVREPQHGAIESLLPNK